MKKLFLLNLFWLLSGVTIAQTKGKNIQERQRQKIVTGFAHDFNDSTWLYLEEYNQENGAVEIIDSSLVIDERFLFTSKKILTKTPKYFTVRTKTWSEYKVLWIEDKPIVFSGVKSNFSHAVINGSVSQYLIERFERLTFPIVTEIDSLNRNYGNTDSIIFEKIKTLQDLLVQKSTKYIEDNPTAFISVKLLATNCIEWGKKISQHLFNKLSAENKRTFFGKSVERFISLNQAIDIDSQYTGIKQSTPEGKMISLSYCKGKYILLEFWASWCGPCRKENPNLVATFNEFKNKGFEIFDVSLDVSDTSWKKAIAEDGLTWLQVSELNGGQNSATLIYGVYGIPQNYLIDMQGKIIAKNLKGDELRNKLKEIFR